MWFEWLLFFVLSAIALISVGATVLETRKLRSTQIGLFFALLALGTWFFVLN